jgi:riboflavin kinase, archaea type
MVLRGQVVSGVGSFAYWIKQLQGHYERKTGMILYPGTLNLKLDSEYSLPARVIRLEAAEYGGRVSVSIVPCSIKGRKAFLLRTDANEQGRGDHPKTIVEIATDVKLRDLYQLQDGDYLELTIDPEWATSQSGDSAQGPQA